MIELHPLAGIREVLPGDDIGGLLHAALADADLLPFRPGDIVVVTQKIVSKSEGRFLDLASLEPDEEARTIAARTAKDPRFVAAVLSESSDVVRAIPNVLITRHHAGHIMANAGIDRSNLGPGEGDRVLLLPADADQSAASIRARLGALSGGEPAVVVSDSFGRPWRHGVTGAAIGASGLPALVDRRGEYDRDGRLLEVTQVALADIVATAATLVTGEGAEGVPAALLRGAVWPKGDRPATALVRPLAEDLFQ